MNSVFDRFPQNKNQVSNLASKQTYFLLSFFSMERARRWLEIHLHLQAIRIPALNRFLCKGGLTGQF